MVAFAHPPLEVQESSRTLLQESRATSLELAPILVRQREGRGGRINAESQMNHFLSRLNRTLRRRDVVSKMHGRIQESIDGARRLGTAGTLRKQGIIK